MQPIERYGLVALLFLVVTVVAVVLWDKKSEKDKQALALAQKDEQSLVQPAPAGTDPLSGFGQALPTEEPGVVGLGRSGWAPSGSLKLNDTPAAAPLGTPGAALPAGQGNGFLDPNPTGNAGVAAPSPSAVASTYKVQKGDTYSSIAARMLGSANRYAEIERANPGVDPRKLKVGQELKLPATGSGSTGATTNPPAVAKNTPAGGASTSTPRSGRSYTVKSGDSLWKIAERELGNGSRSTEIAALNPSANPNALEVGQVLLLPAGSSPNVTRVAAVAPASSPAKSGKVK